MIPPLDSPIWKRIVTGQKPVSSSKLAINLMLKSVQISFQKDPSPANVQTLVGRMHEFFAQYEHAFADDFKVMLG